MKTQTKATKAGKKGAAQRITSEVPVLETVQAPVMVVKRPTGVDGIMLDGQRAEVATTLDIPQPTMRENDRWPWTGWNVQYMRKQVEKDLRRMAQTIANLEHVSRTVAARESARAEKKATAAAAAQPHQTAQPAAAS